MQDIIEELAVLWIMQLRCLLDSTEVYKEPLLEVIDIIEAGMHNDIFIDDHRVDLVSLLAKYVVPFYREISVDVEIEILSNTLGGERTGSS